MAGLIRFQDQGAHLGLRPDEAGTGFYATTAPGNDIPGIAVCTYEMGIQKGLISVSRRQSKRIDSSMHSRPIGPPLFAVASI